MSEQPWINIYAGMDSRKFRFVVDSKGIGILKPFKDRDELGARREWIEFEPTIEVIDDAGIAKRKSLQKEGFTAITESGSENETITYQGTVTGGARFQVTFEIGRKAVSAGGHLIDLGNLEKKGTVRFSIRVKIPKGYAWKEDKEALEDLADGDRVDLSLRSGETLKLDGFELIHGDELPNDIMAARIEFEGYRFGRIELQSDPTSSFQLWNRGKQSLYKGFSMNWSVDSGSKSPESARLSLIIK